MRTSPAVAKFKDLSYRQWSRGLELRYIIATTMVLLAAEVAIFPNPISALVLTATIGAFAICLWLVVATSSYIRLLVVKRRLGYSLLSPAPLPSSRQLLLDNTTQEHYFEFQVTSCTADDVEVEAHGSILAQVVNLDAALKAPVDLESLIFDTVTALVTSLIVTSQLETILTTGPTLLATLRTDTAAELAKSGIWLRHLVVGISVPSTTSPYTTQ